MGRFSYFKFQRPLWISFDDRDKNADGPHRDESLARWGIGTTAWIVFALTRSPGSAITSPSRRERPSDQEGAWPRCTATDRRAPHPQLCKDEESRMDTGSSRPETLRAGSLPHRWTRVDEPRDDAVVASYETVIAGGGPPTS
jgi:hypothetical protein